MTVLQHVTPYTLVEIYHIFSNPIRTFLQFQRAKKSDADYLRGRELDFGKMTELLYVP